MKVNRMRMTLSVIMVLTLAFGAIVMVQGEEAEEDPVLKIETVDLTIENKSSTLRIDLDITGTAHKGTDHVNLTLGFKNETTDEILPLWLEPIDQNIFLIAGLKHGPKGTVEEPWIQWKTSAYANVPLDMGDLLSLLDLIGPSLGLNLSILDELQNLDQLGNVSLPENISDISDITDLITIPKKSEAVSYLEGTEIYIIARAVDSEGSYTESSKNVKMDLIDSLYDFFIEEGYVEAETPVDTDNDDETSEKEDSKDDGIPFLSIILVIGVVLIIISIVSIVVYMVTRNKE